jgi:geranylgeranyl pyrophosphate synthase
MTEYRNIYLPYRAKYLKEHGKDILDGFHKTPEFLAYEERKNAKAIEKKEAKVKAKTEKKAIKEVNTEQKKVNIINEVVNKPKVDKIKKEVHNRK